MELKIYTDGGSLNNPGPAACAYVIYVNDTVLLKHGERIGTATNNFAEYTGLIKALEKVRELIEQKHLGNINKITSYSDSQLMVNQLNGLYKVKNGTIRELILKVRILEQEIKTPITYIHVLREKNTLADSLVKEQFGR